MDGVGLKDVDCAIEKEKRGVFGQNWPSKGKKVI